MKKEKNVLAYIVKTADGKRLKIFYDEYAARQFVINLMVHGCEVELKVEELT